MKSIEPIEIWLNGEQQTAHYLKVTGTFDNYENTATVFYGLFSMFIDNEGIKTPAQQLTGGYLDISGQDYINWGDTSSPNANIWIYEWVASKRNIVII